MNNTIKISVARGAGLSFLIACMGFVLLGQYFMFALVPVGALVGFGIGYFLERNPAVTNRIQSKIISKRVGPARVNWLANALLHPKLLIRLASLTIFGLSLLLIAWSIGYYLLPEGLFRGGAETHLIRSALNTSSSSVLEEWSKIFKANSIPALLILGSSLLIRVNRFSFGYLIALYNIAGYGLFLGTNSFAIPMSIRMAPSLAVFERSGPYEMFALVMLAAASYGWSHFEIKRLFRTNPERIIPSPKISIAEIAISLLGIGILAVANWREALMVMQATLPN